MRTGSIFLDKKTAVVALFYFTISAVFLFTYGIQTGGEAEKFLDNGNRVINGQDFFNGVFGYFYLVYSLLVALFIKLSVNLIFIGVFQIVLSFFAALCLYRLLDQVLGRSSIAFLFFIARFTKIKLKSLKGKKTRISSIVFFMLICIY